MKKYELKSTSNPNIKRICDRSGDWTHYWFVKEKLAVRAVNFILSQGYAAPRLLEWAKGKSEDSIDKVLKAAGDEGDASHQAILRLIETKKIDRTDQVLAEDNKTKRQMTDEEWDNVLAFGQFYKDHDVQVLLAERTVAGDGYAGTLDWIGTLRKPCESRYCTCKDYIGKLGLWDHKTGSGIYPNYGAQLAAYAAAMVLKIKGFHIGYTAIDHLGTKHNSGYKLEFYNLDQTAIHWQEFLAAKTIHDGAYKPFNLEEENTEVPDSIDLTKPTTKPATKELTNPTPKLRKKKVVRKKAKNKVKQNKLKNGKS